MVGDLEVGEAVGGQIGDPAFAGGQGGGAGAGGSAGA